MLFRPSDPNSPPPTSHKNYFLLSPRGGCPVVLLIRFILTWTSHSHKEVLDMEIQFFRETVNEMDPKLLIDHIQRMASGEAPFFSTTLSLVYDKVVEQAFTEHTPFGPGPDDCTEGESLVHPTPPQASTPTSNVPPPPLASTVSSSSNSQAPVSAHEPVPTTTTPNSTWLICQRCRQPARLGDLREGLCCPRCPRRGIKARPLMQCTSCNSVRGTLRADCERRACRKIFM